MRIASPTKHEFSPPKEDAPNGEPRCCPTQEAAPIKWSPPPMWPKEPWTKKSTSLHCPSLQPMSTHRADLISPSISVLSVTSIRYSWVINYPGGFQANRGQSSTSIYGQDKKHGGNGWAKGYCVKIGIACLHWHKLVQLSFYVIQNPTLNLDYYDSYGKKKAKAQVICHVIININCRLNKKPP